MVINTQQGFSSADPRFARGIQTDARTYKRLFGRKRSGRKKPSSSTSQKQSIAKSKQQNIIEIAEERKAKERELKETQTRQSIAENRKEIIDGVLVEQFVSNERDAVKYGTVTPRDSGFQTPTARGMGRTDLRRGGRARVRDTLGGGGAGTAVAQTGHFIGTKIVKPTQKFLDQNLVSQKIIKPVAGFAKERVQFAEKQIGFAPFTGITTVTRGALGEIEKRPLSSTVGLYSVGVLGGQAGALVARLGTGVGTAVGGVSTSVFLGFEGTRLAKATAQGGAKGFGTTVGKDLVRFGSFSAGAKFGSKSFKEATSEIKLTRNLRGKRPTEIIERSVDIATKKTIRTQTQVTGFGETAPPRELITTTPIRKFLGLSPIETKFIPARTFKFQTDAFAPNQDILVKVNIGSSKLTRLYKVTPSAKEVSVGFEKGIKTKVVRGIGDVGTTDASKIVGDLVVSRANVKFLGKFKGSELIYSPKTRGTKVISIRKDVDSFTDDSLLKSSKVGGVGKQIKSIGGGKVFDAGEGVSVQKFIGVTQKLKPELKPKYFIGVSGRKSFVLKDGQLKPIDLFAVGSGGGKAPTTPAIPKSGGEATGIFGELKLEGRFTGFKQGTVVKTVSEPVYVSPFFIKQAPSFKTLTTTRQRQETKQKLAPAVINEAQFKTLIASKSLLDTKLAQGQRIGQATQQQQQQRQQQQQKQIQQQKPTSVVPILKWSPRYKIPTEIIGGGRVRFRDTQRRFSPRKVTLERRTPRGFRRVARTTARSAVTIGGRFESFRVRGTGAIPSLKGFKLDSTPSGIVFTKKKTKKKKKRR